MCSAANTTYKVENVKVKKAFGSTSLCPIELLIDARTRVNKAVKQLDFENLYIFNSVSQVLRGEAGSRFINLKAKVVEIDEVEIVGTDSDSRSKKSIYMADETGSIELVLWRNKAENFNFQVGDVLEIQSVVASEFSGCKIISSISESTFKKLEEDMEIIQNTQKRSERYKSNVSSMSTYVLAVKDFKCSIPCLACKRNIDLLPNRNKAVVKCSCPAKCTFLIETAPMNNQCSILLSNKQWYSVNSTAVSIL